MHRITLVPDNAAHIEGRVEGHVGRRGGAIHAYGDRSHDRPPPQLGDDRENPARHARHVPLHNEVVLSALCMLGGAECAV